jgi:hypothetical protein
MDKYFKKIKIAMIQANLIEDRGSYYGWIPI